MEYREIRWEILPNPKRPAERTIGVLTMNRPDQLNSLTPRMRLEMDALLGELRYNDSVRVVVLTGAERGFSGGGDLTSEAEVLLGESDSTGLRGPYKELMEYFFNDVRHVYLQRLVRRLEDLPQVTIAALNGWAVGAGLEMAAAADMRIASASARFAEVAVAAGFLTEAGGARNLTKLIGKGRALDLILTGRRLDTTEAERIGLVDRVLPPDGFMEAVMGIAGQIAANPYLSVRKAKELVGYYWKSDRSDEGWDRELDAIMQITRTRDCQEGIRAFQARREPRYQGPNYLEDE